METVLIGLLGGLVTGISPCVLPVLPVVFLTAGVVPGGQGSTPEAVPASRRRPFWVIAGLVTSFSLVTLLGSALLSLLPLPQDTIRWIGIAVLLLLGIGLLFPAVQHLLERPFQSLIRHSPENRGNGFGTGLALGAVFVPCAGPVLAGIVVAGTTGAIGPDTVALTLSFAVGVAVPLLVFALAGSKVSESIRRFRNRERGFRIAAGIAMVALAGGLVFDVPQTLQRLIPDYTSTIQEGLTPDRDADASNQGSIHDCTSGAPELQSCGPAPEISGITAWLNTPDGEAIGSDDLRGKVTLVDFWTFACINCQRAIPHVAAWFDTYQDAGLEVIGVHSPEYAFEHEIKGVKAGAKDLGIRYPIAVDNDFETWTNFENQYWPALYLIDADGEVRHVAFGEGRYDETENLIRELLHDADPDIVLPEHTDVPDQTPGFW